MNHVYRTVWNQALGCYVAAPEIASTGGKTHSQCSGSKPHARFVAKLAVLVAALVSAGVVMAQDLPTGGSVTAGSGSISQTGNQLTVLQNSQHLAADWQSFNIGAGHTVEFVQPSASAVALNRVIGSDASTIAGSLKANGHVFLLNPNGLLFTSTAQVSVGSLVASTLNLSNDDFVAGRYQLSGSSTNAIINQGRIEAAQGGSIALIATRIVNEGQLQAAGGNVLLGAGQQVTLDFGGPVQLQVDQGALDAQIANGGAILAQEGMVLLTAKAADALGNAVINQSGIIEASSLQAQGGSIRLSAEGGAIIQTGQLKADGASGGQIDAQARAIIDAGQWSATGGSGQGGSIQVQASQGLEQTAASQINASGSQGGHIRLDGGTSAYLSGSSRADGHTGQGGEVSATAQSLTLAGAQLSANGSAGGGRVRVGGGWQGADADLRNALQTTVTATTQLSASALDQGDGGTVVVWSDEGTGVAASITAKGGAQGGNGGKVETSSKGQLAFAAQVDVTAPQGQAGQVLLDPKNIIIGSGDVPSYSLTPLTYANPQAGDSHGSRGVVALSNGNIVVASPYDNQIAKNSGAVRLYTQDGTLLSTLTGSSASDSVGSGGITALSNGNYVVRSESWSGGRGAVTWVDGSQGSSGTVGVVSSSNSLVGTTAGDSVGSGGITALTNGNYVVRSYNWNGDRGAVTWVDGSQGSSGWVGVVSASNSLVGTRASDCVGLGGIAALTDGNYVVRSYNWNGRRGALTWVDGSQGSSGWVGVVSSSNSLVGTQVGDCVGWGGITALTDGNYVVNSYFWNGGRGAVTWVDGSQGSSGWVGVVSSSNSLVGTTADDNVGRGGITALTDGNYVVRSQYWDGYRGAVTWVDGSQGSSGWIGVVSSSNSLVGTTARDCVGIGGMTALTDGNYVVSSYNWNDGRGAVTWVDGSKGSSGWVGVVSSSNSLVGTTARDQVGSGGITALTNGNYVVLSQNWNNGGTVANAGAVTWVDGSQGSSGTVGVVSSSNSLVGTTAGDCVGYGGITALTNGNYVVNSYFWNGGRGAVTWVDGSQGSSGWVGVVSSSNSLVGTTADDNVGRGGITALTDGNYVVLSQNWNNGGTAANAGAVTWVDGSQGSSGTVGVVSSSNSLVGTTARDYVGSGGMTKLTNGNYVVNSRSWNGGRGAVTWVDGSQGSSGWIGAVSSSNSLVGTTASDCVGSGGITALTNGSYVVSSPRYQGGRGQVVIVQPNSPLTSQPLPQLSYSTVPGADYTLSVSQLAALLSTGAQVTLQANNDITLNAQLSVNNGGNGGHLMLQAGRSIMLNADVVTDNGNLTLIANDTAANGVVSAHRDAGAANITQAAGTAINAGTRGTVSLQIRDGQGVSNAQAGVITLATVHAADLLVDSTGLSASLNASNKVYDGTATASATATLTGLVLQNGSNLSHVPVVASFADSEVGDGKAVTLASGVELTGFNGTQLSVLQNGGVALKPTATANITAVAVDTGTSQTAQELPTAARQSLQALFMPERPAPSLQAAMLNLQLDDKELELPPDSELQQVR